jgi:hypothetical protein
MAGHESSKSSTILFFKQFYGVKLSQKRVKRERKMQRKNEEEALDLFVGVLEEQFKDDPKGLAEWLLKMTMLIESESDEPSDDEISVAVDKLFEDIHDDILQIEAEEKALKSAQAVE